MNTMGSHEYRSDKHPLHDRIEELERQNKLMRDTLEYCRFALEPYDDVKPRDWKTDREHLAFAHQKIKALAAVGEK